jgi:hypothetical protein
MQSGISQPVELKEFTAQCTRFLPPHPSPIKIPILIFKPTPEPFGRPFLLFQLFPSHRAVKQFSRGGPSNENCEDHRPHQVADEDPKG